MKKNVIGRVPLHKEPVRRRLSSWHIPARLLCLLLAVLIWLAIVNLNAISEEDEKDSKPKTEQAE
ncbi:MAG: hypothetical protein IJW29_07170 [Clostridia bacterium]|nr:hypothetical protein [Clostridia bacterium]